MKLKYKILDNRIGTEFDIPRYQTAGSAGMDLIACCDESITLSPNESTIETLK
jgi:dUTPase